MSSVHMIRHRRRAEARSAEDDVRAVDSGEIVHPSRVRPEDFAGQTFEEFLSTKNVETDSDDDDDEDDDTIHSLDDESFSPLSPPVDLTSPSSISLPPTPPENSSTDEKKLSLPRRPELALPDMTSPEPPLKVTERDVRRAASLLRRRDDDDDEETNPRRRRSKSRDDLPNETDRRLLMTPSDRLNSLSRSSSPASGAIRQISKRLCPSVTSLDSVLSLEPSVGHTPRAARLSHHKRQKVDKILAVLEEDPVNVSAVRQMAISKCGLVGNDVRVRAWPKLLNVDTDKKLQKRPWHELTLHRDYNQVVLDVKRSLRRFPPGLTEEEQQLLQEKLNTLILRVLCEHEELHYYQGYHDICVTFLLAVGEDLAFALLDRLSTHHLRDFMDATMERTTHILNYLLPLVGRVDPELREFVEAADVGTVFALSWLITWYGHVLNELKHIVRLYDFFLACHPLMPLYLAAAIVLHRRDEILAVECDFALLHCALSKVPEDLPWERLISKAGDYFIQFPPSSLAAEAEEQYQKGMRLRETRQAAAAAARGSGGRAGRGQVMTRASNGAWIALKQPKRVAARIVMWTLYASVGAAAYAVYSAGGFGWLWSGQ